LTAKSPYLKRCRTLCVYQDQGQCFIFFVFDVPGDQKSQSISKTRVTVATTMKYPHTTLHLAEYCLRSTSLV